MTNRLAHDLLIKERPMPQFAVDEVLLSRDLSCSILSSLGLEDYNAAAVCRTWRQAWTATSATRRGLRPAAFEATWKSRIGRACKILCTTADGRLVIKREKRRKSNRDGDEEEEDDGDDDEEEDGESDVDPDDKPEVELYILDDRLKDSQLVLTGEFPAHVRAIACDGGLYVWWHDRDEDRADHVLQRWRLDDDGSAVLLASAFMTGCSVNGLAIAPGGILFALCREFAEVEDRTYNISLVAIDPLTLQLERTIHTWRTTFVRAGGATDMPCGLTVVGDEFYVLVSGENGGKSGDLSFQVYSASGEYRRQVTNEDLKDMRPARVEFFDGRLYVAERFPFSGREKMRDRREMPDGRDGCLIVLTPEGETRQIYELQTGVANSLCVFAGCLLVSSHGENDRVIGSWDPTYPNNELDLEVLWGL